MPMQHLPRHRSRSGNDRSDGHAEGELVHRRASLCGSSAAATRARGPFARGGCARPCDGCNETLRRLQGARCKRATIVKCLASCRGFACAHATIGDRRLPGQPAAICRRALVEQA
jgi:hypothetical protein